MWIMAADTFPVFHRLMHYPLELFFGRIGMTGITEIPHLLLEQAVEFSDMGAVAGKAFADGRRIMRNAFLEWSLLVAVETVNGCYRLIPAPLMTIAT